ncbi:P27 family phage terminase small subunit [Stakelama marina]|uniref:P27 family phage terminase small subunit n=1 Tax=Stakelama marina TaxID=2826939 RepID=A0A8T4IBH4_9SPHN|nr:P27 family phage terminase small subunit [Stakelama marina]MBR0551741.1 P27 family phage terminase small subunit [Stakelama marina]
MKLIEGGSGIPPEPDWSAVFPGRAKSIAADRANATRYWHDAIADLRATEKLSVVNGHALQRLVIAYILYDRAAVEVIREGPIVPAPRTKTPMHSPWATAMRDASRMANAIEAELTLSPRRRASGGKVNRRSRKPGASDQYLKSVPTENNDDEK